MSAPIAVRCQPNGFFLLFHTTDGAALSREELTDLLAELNELREVATKIRVYPREFHAVEDLYNGPAAGLIDAVVDRVERAFCDVLGVKSFMAYESDGGLEDAIKHDAFSLLTAAGLIDRITGENAAQQIAALRQLCADIYTGMLVAGWHEDELVRRVKAARAGADPTASTVMELRKRVAELERTAENGAKVILAHDQERIAMASRIAELERDLAAERRRAAVNAATLTKYAAECFPEIVNGQKHFVRVLMESVAEDITAPLDEDPAASAARDEAALAAIGEHEHSAANGGAS